MTFFFFIFYNIYLNVCKVCSTCSYSEQIQNASKMRLTYINVQRLWWATSNGLKSNWLEITDLGQWWKNHTNHIKIKQLMCHTFRNWLYPFVAIILSKHFMMQITENYSTTSPFYFNGCLQAEEEVRVFSSRLDKNLVVVSQATLCCCCFFCFCLPF